MVELDSIIFLNIVTRVWLYSVDHLLSGFLYWATYQLFMCSKWPDLDMKECVKSPISDNIWTEHVLISEDTLLPIRKCEM